MLDRHEIPTHLEVVDKLVFGLTARQLTVVGLGLTLGYTLWQHLGAGAPAHGLSQAAFASGLPWPLRLLVAALPVALASALAFVRWRDRTLEVWGLASLRYLVLAKRAVWRPRPRTVAPQTDEELRALAGLVGLSDEVERGSAPDGDVERDRRSRDLAVPNWDAAGSLAGAARLAAPVEVIGDVVRHFAASPALAGDAPAASAAHTTGRAQPPSPALIAVARLAARLPLLADPPSPERPPDGALQWRPARPDTTRTLARHLDPGGPRTSPPA